MALVIPWKPVPWLQSDYSNPPPGSLPPQVPKALILFGLSQIQRSRERGTDRMLRVLYPIQLQSLQPPERTRVPGANCFGSGETPWTCKDVLERSCQATCPPGLSQLSCQHTWLVKIQQEHQHFAPQGLVSSKCSLWCEFLGPILKGCKIILVAESAQSESCPPHCPGLTMRLGALKVKYLKQVCLLFL